MKRNELQRFGSGLANLHVLLEIDSQLYEYSLIGNGELLRSLLKSLSLTSSTALTRSLTITNEKSGRFLQSTVELTLKSSGRTSATSNFFLLATLTKARKSSVQTSLGTLKSDSLNGQVDRTVLSESDASAFARGMEDFYSLSGLLSL